MKCFCGNNKFIFKESLNKYYCKFCGKMIKEIKFFFEGGGKEIKKKKKNLEKNIELDMNQDLKRKNSKLKKINLWHYKLKMGEKKEKNLSIAKFKLEKYRESISLNTEIKKKILDYYSTSLNKNLIKGRSIEGILLGCLYLVFKENNLPLSLKEISKRLNFSKKIIGRNFRFIQKKLNLKKNNLNYNIFLKKSFFILKLNESQKKELNKIFKLKFLEKFFSGKSSMSVIGSIIFWYLKKNKIKISFKEFSKKLNITEITLKERYNELINFFFINSLI